MDDERQILRANQQRREHQRLGDIALVIVGRLSRRINAGCRFSRAYIQAALSSPRARV